MACRRRVPTRQPSGIIAQPTHPFIFVFIFIFIFVFIFISVFIFVFIAI